jgi:hypothetical protein
MNCIVSPEQSSVTVSAVESNLFPHAGPQPAGNDDVVQDAKLIENRR